MTNYCRLSTCEAHYLLLTADYSQHSAVIRKQSAFTSQQLAVSINESAGSSQQSRDGSQQSAICSQQSAFENKFCLLAKTSTRRELYISRRGDHNYFKLWQDFPEHQPGERLHALRK